MSIPKILALVSTDPDIGWWPIILIAMAFSMALFLLEILYTIRHNRRVRRNKSIANNVLLPFVLFVSFVVQSHSTDICRVNYNGAGTITIESCEPIPNHEYWWWIVYSVGELQPRPGIASRNYNPDYKLRLDYASNQTQEFIQLLDLTARPDDQAAFKALASTGQGKLIKATLYTNGIPAL